MNTENNTKKNTVNIFTVRMDKQMQDMISYLQGKKLLNKTSVLRWCVAEVYEREKANDIKNGDD